ncbi:hypothetical protein [Candidatus Poriferisodalis sp.]|uniref:hypothetical protein n=1 Tax=Candidatus Poriferisodalis sp. TaxID=3101277 RepID=UPI003D0B330D
MNFVDLEASPNEQEALFPSADVSRGLIFDFGIPSLWRRVLGHIQRVRNRKNVRNLASG